jgi:hypothetical protein
VENGVVLLFSDGPATMPMRLDVIDAAGDVVDTDEWGSSTNRRRINARPGSHVSKTYLGFLHVARRR